MSLFSNKIALFIILECSFKNTIKLKCRQNFAADNIFKFNLHFKKPFHVNRRHFTAGDSHAADDSH